MAVLSNKRKMHFRAGVFVCVSFAVLIGAVAFLIIKKRTFAEYVHYALSSSSAISLSEGMPLLYSGFEIGRISGLTLNDDGLVLIAIEVSVEHASRIRGNSRFFLEKPVIGLPRLFVTTEIRDGEHMPPAADRVFQLEVVDEFSGLLKRLPLLVEKIDRIAMNMENITSEKGALNQSIQNVNTMTDQLAKNKGIELLVGETSGRRLQESIAQLNRTLRASTELLQTATQTLHLAETKVLGQEGTVDKINTIADDITAKLRILDSLVSSLVVIGQDVEGSTSDLSVVRERIDATVNAANALIMDVRNALPMEQQKEIPLP